jgi:hypothetical protein
MGTWAKEIADLTGVNGADYDIIMSTLDPLDPTLPTVVNAKIQSSCVEVINRLPPSKLQFLTTKLTDSGSGIQTMAADIITKVVSVTKAGYKASLVDGMDSSRFAASSGSIYEATPTSPVYFIKDAKYFVEPGGGDIYVATLPIIEYDDTYLGASDSSDPKGDLLAEIAPAILYRASQNMLTYMIGRHLDELPTDLDQNSLNQDTTDVFELIADFNETTSLNIASYFTELATLIDDEEDVELAGMKISQIQALLGEMTTELGASKTEYDTNLAKRLQLYTTRLAKEKEILLIYQGRVLQLEKMYNEQLQMIVGTA